MPGISNLPRSSNDLRSVAGIVIPRMLRLFGNRLREFTQLDAAIAQPLRNLVLRALRQKIRNAPIALRPPKIVVQRGFNIVPRDRIFCDEVLRPCDEVGKPFKRCRSRVLQNEVFEAFLRVHK